MWEISEEERAMKSEKEVQELLQHWKSKKLDLVVKGIITILELILEEPKNYFDGIEFKQCPSNINNPHKGNEGQMKIYKLFIGSTDWVPEEDKCEGWIKYSDIKDDRDLLEEAVKLIRKHHDAHPIYDPTGLQEEDADFLARAKERLKK